MYLLLVPGFERRLLSDYVFAFEEPENNLHPAVQRRLLSFIIDYAVKNNLIVFLTTHSNVILDLAANNDSVGIHSVVHDGTRACISPVRQLIDSSAILDELGFRASDLLQSNGIVWVEGPSDRVYINDWISKWTDQKLKEGVHYLCLFYGGRLLAHITGAHNVKDLEELIHILLANRHNALIADSDKRTLRDVINRTKRRIQSEFARTNALFWITDGKEIENYLPAEAIAKHLHLPTAKPVKPFQAFDSYLTTLRAGEGRLYLADKVAFARAVTANITRTDLASNTALLNHIQSLTEEIQKWNSL
jgi:hypothetical protein